MVSSFVLVETGDSRNQEKKLMAILLFVESFFRSYLPAQVVTKLRLYVLIYPNFVKVRIDASCTRELNSDRSSDHAILRLVMMIHSMSVL